MRYVMRKSNIAMAGVRRTWDKDYYEKRARDRAEQGDSFEEEDAAGNKAKARKIIKVIIFIYCGIFPLEYG